MEEGIRVTTQRKSKKVVTILLVITGILGLALIGVAIYFYSIKSTSNNTNASNITCGCYYIDPAVTTDCGDPRRAFQFETATVLSTQSCKASCATSKLSTNLLNSSTEQDLYQICQLSSITDNRCQSMTITDKDGKIVTGKIDSTNQLNITAVFDKEYSNYSFTINNESVDPDVVSPNKLTISKTITDLSTSSAINIVATGTTSDGSQINSTICRRLIEVTQPGVSTVSNMQIQTRQADTSTKVSDTKISTGTLSSSSSVKIDFTFGTSFSELIMTKGFTIDSTSGVVEIVEQDLYNATNFSNSKSFSELDGYVGDLAIKAEVFVNNASIGSATQTIKFTTTSSSNNTNNTVASSFTVTNTTNQTCVERVTPSNTVQYTIGVTNKSTTSQNITSVTDKLPLGFVYTTGTTKLNGVSVTDSSYVTATTTGSTQELVIAKTGGWTLSANQTLTIIFQATAGTDALTGSNLNEVVVTPEQIPTDPTTLRTSVSLTVAQDCSNPNNTTDNTPQTGIFDSTIFKVLVGLSVVALGWYIYSRPKGQLIAAKVVDSEVFKATELNTWRIFNPKKYFEEVVVKKSQRKKN